MSKSNYYGESESNILLPQSPRGKFIMAQALYLGVNKLREVEGVHREVSNIKDMQYLLHALFPGMEGVFKLLDEEKENARLLR